MLLDAQNRYSDAQAVTATAASTDLIDHGIARDLGVGENLYVVVIVDVAMTDASSDSTLAVTIETDALAAFGSATTTQALFTIPALSAIGAKFIARLQPDAINEQFSRLKYTPANGSLSTGSFTAFITHDIDKFIAYADNITIS